MSGHILAGFTNHIHRRLVSSCTSHSVRSIVLKEHVTSGIFDTIFQSGYCRMKTKPKEPEVPRERAETVRSEIISLLKEQTLSAKEISGIAKLPEKDVLFHLDHISRKSGLRLGSIPSVCKRCGFEFKKRERLSKPGKCPICRNQQIEPQRFFID